MLPGVVDVACVAQTQRALLDADEVVEEVGILDLDRVAYETCRYR